MTHCIELKHHLSIYIFTITNKREKLLNVHSILMKYHCLYVTTQHGNGIGDCHWQHELLAAFMHSSWDCHSDHGTRRL